VVYAKSRPPESLRDHTHEVLENVVRLRTYYPEIEERIPERYRSTFWKLLELVAGFHDLGKIHTPFQNEILKHLHEKPLNVPKGIRNIPHNILSCSLLEEASSQFDREIQPIIYQSVAWHHDRGQEFLDDNEWLSVIRAIVDDLTPNMDRLSDTAQLLHFPISSKPNAKFRFQLKTKLPHEDARKLFIFLKGFLHRADHSASAHVPSETDRLSNSEKKTTNYIHTSAPTATIWQLSLALNLSNDNVIMEASTGMGKTEFALYWLNGCKGFYTLPVRTSVNAMFERIRKTLQTERIGLLHSSALWHLVASNARSMQEEEIGLKTTLAQNDSTRQLAEPISVSTVDQLFTATFHYPGYEKIYSTLAYSKVVIDEIQSYETDVAAVIMKGLKDIAKLGGRFCVMTATLPTFYKKYLQESVPTVKIPPPQISRIRKHKLKIVNSDIDQNLGIIIEKAHELKKILIIVNTVKKAQFLYKALEDSKSEHGVKVNLLHRSFTNEHRRIKENGNQLNEGILNASSGIWITTQLAEVSLNIDFPCLFTELSSIDSIVQRMGRTNRFANENYESVDPNFYVFSIASGIPSIYDKDLVRFSLEALSTFDGGSALSALQESQLVSTVYDKEDFKETAPYRKFETSRRLLEELNFEAESKREAQDILRHIASVDVIPAQVYDSNDRVINEALDTLAEKGRSREDRIRAYLTLYDFKLPIPAWAWYKYNPKPLRDDTDIFLVSGYDYSFERGLSNDPGSESFIF
jgi:CRISPR-associated endonuclease/helicase Cas3